MSNPKKQFIGQVFGVVLSLAIGALVFMKLINPYLPYEPDPELNPDKAHTHADFAIWIGDELLDFSDNEFMSGLSTSDESHDEEDEYLHKYFHLHDNVSHVVHQHKPDLYMGEFFESLGMKQTEDCFTLDEAHGGQELCNEGGQKNWRMFVNGKEMKMDPDYDFKDLEKILYTYDVNKEQLENAFKKMTDDSCKYSQACPWRGPPPEENCIADPSVPCIADLEDDFS